MKKEHNAAERRAVAHSQEHTDVHVVTYLRRENVKFIEPLIYVAPKQHGLESSRLRCLECPSTDGLSTSMIQYNQPAKAGNRH